eukprot:CAMPEP_0204555364 /NCGR_PEP_ID=MMETSP0661-20131031/28785_1 /ASSEMBLY_ACC=CAM_ASM_000606 /TAXON_ID=109239 /ORGANISM="Alexandrium margalefi, Strain AMGDE01CS-322" /LENGTH=80 /DNA_ID=CAMNT_0051562451 /DNA_START=115 /DNA_END=354 /DNA_ORIENTATION=+
MALEVTVANNPGPDCPEELDVQLRPELPAALALEVDAEEGDPKPRVRRERLIAVDGVLVAGEEARVPAVLHGQQLRLVAG